MYVCSFSMRNPSFFFMPRSISAVVKLSSGIDAKDGRFDCYLTLAVSDEARIVFPLALFLILCT